MARVARHLGREETPVTRAGSVLPNVGAIGIELELEGNCRWPEVQGWRRESDGSLRNGIEYIFDGPQMGQEAEDSIHNMGITLSDLNGLAPSFRCSTHIHMDVKDLEVDQVEKLVLAYMMLEPVMFDHCSMERRFSNFCTPMFINTEMTSMFSRLFRNAGEERFKVHNMAHWPKYSALNLKPMTEYGSVEFRGSHALITSNELLDLACRMLSLKQLALRSETSQSAAAFIQSVRSMTLQDIFSRGLREGYVPEEQQMDKCFASALAVVHRPQPNAVPAPPVGIRPSRTGQPRLDYYRGNVPVDASVLERYNLFVPPDRTMEINQLIRLVGALRNINGITRPRFADFCPQWRDFMGSSMLVRTLELAGTTAQAMGF